MDDLHHDANTEAREEFLQRLRETFEAKTEQITRLLMDGEDGDFFGPVQFQLRTLLMELGREANDQALAERKKTADRQSR